jgi:hypothetical protein
VLAAVSATIVPTAYTVYPDGWESDDRLWGGGHWTLRIEYRDEGRYCVTDGFGVFRKTGVHEYEPRPSGRHGPFKKRTRFDLEAAQALALRLVDERRVNGLTFAEAKEIPE